MSKCNIFEGFSTLILCYMYFIDEETVDYAETSQQIKDYH